MLTSNVGKERILLYGQEGVGKTRAYFSIAKKMAQTGSEGKVWVVDLDGAFHRMQEGFHLNNMMVTQPQDFPEVLDDVRIYAKDARPDDWLAIDGLGEAWTYAQESFYTRVHKKDMVDWMVENLNKDVNDYGRSANTQNKLWRELSNLLVGFPGHVMGCTPAKQVATSRDGTPLDPTQSRYGSVGWQPEGNKRVGYVFHTVLLLSEVGGKWIYSTVKDRERERQVNAKLGDFVVDYLVKVAGWHL